MAPAKCPDVYQKSQMISLLFHRKLVWILLLGFALRVAVRWHSGEQDFWNGYPFFFAMAQNIAAGNGIALDEGALTAFRVPLYSFFLAAVTFGHQVFVPVLLAQSVVGTATVWCAAMLAREIFGKNAISFAAFLTAIYPYYVVHDTALQETSLYTFLLAVAVLLLLRARRCGSVVSAMSAGLVLGAAVLTRANLAPIALLAPLWLGFFFDGSRRRKLLVGVLCAGVLGLTVSPWLVRTYRLTGAATLSTQTGFFLWLGNNPHTFSHYPTESIDRSQAVALASLNSRDESELKERGSDEVAMDQWFWKKGLDYIRENPWHTLYNSARKIVDAFCWLPSPRRSFWPSLIYSLSYGPVMILGLWGMWATRRHWREHSIFYAQFVSFAAVTALFFGATSYRAYLDVYWIVFAAGILTTFKIKFLSKIEMPQRPRSKAP